MTIVYIIDYGVLVVKSTFGLFSNFMPIVHIVYYNVLFIKGVSHLLPSQVSKLTEANRMAGNFRLAISLSEM